MRKAARALSVPTALGILVAGLTQAPASAAPPQPDAPASAAATSYMLLTMWDKTGESLYEL